MSTEPKILSLKKLGDFYEAYCSDAQTLGRILDVPVCKRGELPMAGFPVHSYDKVLKQIEEAGYQADIEWLPGEVVARWATTGRHQITLFKGETRKSYWYRTRPAHASGGFDAESDDLAIARMENEWGHPDGAGQVTVLKTDKPSLKRVPIYGLEIEEQYR